MSTKTKNNQPLTQAELIALAVQTAMMQLTNNPQPAQPTQAPSRAKSQAQAPTVQPDAYGNHGQPVWFQPQAHTAYQKGVPQYQPAAQPFTRLNETWYYTIDMSTGTVALSSKKRSGSVGPFRTHSDAQDALVALAATILRNARAWRKSNVSE